MTEENKIKPLSWLTIMLILIAAALTTGLLFGLLGKIFNLPSSLTNIVLPAIVGPLAAFLIVRRRERQTILKKI